MPIWHIQKKLFWNMFPAILIPKISTHQRFQKIRCDDTSKMIENMGFIYADGITDQIFALQIFAVDLFNDLNADFNKIEKRVESFGERLIEFREKAKCFINNNNDLDFKKYRNNRYLNIAIPALSNLWETMPGQSTFFIEKASENAEPRLTTKKFSEILPNWEQVDLEISDTLFYQKQLQRELQAEYIDAIEKRQNKPAKNIKLEVKSNSTDQSAAALQSFLEEIPLPNVKVTLPPLVGKTQDWQSKSVYQPVIYGGEKGNLNLIQSKATLKPETTQIFQKNTKTIFTAISAILFDVDNEGVQPNYENSDFINKITITAIEPHQSLEESYILSINQPEKIAKLTFSLATQFEVINTNDIPIPQKIDSKSSLPKQIKVSDEDSKHKTRHRSKSRINIKALSRVGQLIIDIKPDTKKQIITEIIEHKQHSDEKPKGIRHFWNRNKNKNDRNKDDGVNIEISSNKETKSPVKIETLPPPPPPPPPSPPPPLINKDDGPNRIIAPKLSTSKHNLPPKEVNFVDLIKAGAYNLRKKEDFKPLKEKPIINENKPMNELSIADLQVALKQVREQMQCSSSSHESSNSDSSSTW
ncbi:hypothetical protein TRFO_05116 [Tritrichomonas foetus]|uniref:Uncharacterized protein n=1 Tax=Tritrichomonas foetus TaxID=1144522 RepID=A0A1J4KAH7_9EUKA|nr:hypothetical protein TRFO_05116 [Tritrichomonas foetus]|eukprot:OHT07970.1 hypothetical protein TRFO_05116 [Tritrichomonas foetus]